MSVSKDLNRIVYDYNVPYGSIAVITFVYVKLIITHIYSFIRVFILFWSKPCKAIYINAQNFKIFDQAASD